MKAISKAIFSFIPVIILLVCHDVVQAAEKSQLYIGWSCKDITPNKPVSLYGQYYKRISQYVQSPLKVTAFALETEDKNGIKEQAVMVSCDVCLFERELQDSLKQMVAAKIPDFDINKLFMNATHTHSAPYPGSKNTQDVDKDVGMTGQEFHDLLLERATEAVVEAWKGRKAGGISWGLGEAAVGHCRRVQYSDGTTEMYGSTNRPDFIGLEGPSSTGVDMLFCWDVNKKLTGIVINVPCPSQVTESKYYVSSDYWGELRKELKKKFPGDIFILPQCSAAGDQSPRDLPRGYRGEPDMWDVPGAVEIAKRLAHAADAVYPEVQKNIQTEVIFKHLVKNIDLPTHQVSEEDYREAVATANEILSREPKDPNSPETAWNRFLKEMKDNEKNQKNGPWDNKNSDFGILKPKQAIIERYKNQKNDPFYNMELHVIRLGDVAFASNPFELYMDYGLRITARSKAFQTFLIQLSGDCCGYLPTARAIPGGGYSAMVYRVGPEGGQVLVEETLKAINDMW